VAYVKTLNAAIQTELPQEFISI